MDGSETLFNLLLTMGLSYRIFDKLRGKYLDDNCALAQDGAILRMNYEGGGSSQIETLDPRDFIVEPFTGFYDSGGKKIFVGDVLILECFALDYEVVWHFDRFGLMPLYEPDAQTCDIQHFRSQKDLSIGWSVMGNTHEALAL